MIQQPQQVGLDGGQLLLRLGGGHLAALMLIARNLPLRWSVANVELDFPETQASVPLDAADELVGVAENIWVAIVAFDESATLGMITSTSIASRSTRFSNVDFLKQAHENRHAA